MTVTLTVDPFRYAASVSKDCCCGQQSPRSPSRETWPFTPKKFALVGSMKFRLASRSLFGNENPRSITPLTTLNIVVTPADAEREDDDGEGAEDLFLDEDAQADLDVAEQGV